MHKYKIVLKPQTSLFLYLVNQLTRQIVAINTLKNIMTEGHLNKSLKENEKEVECNEVKFELYK